MGWLTMLLPLILKLIEWLTNQNKLNARQKKRVNLLLAKTEELRTVAQGFGCKPIADATEQDAILDESGMG